MEKGGGEMENGGERGEGGEGGEGVGEKGNWLDVLLCVFFFVHSFEVVTVLLFFKVYVYYK